MVLNWLRGAGNHTKISYMGRLGWNQWDFVNLGLLGLIKKRIEAWYVYGELVTRMSIENVETGEVTTIGKEEKGVRIVDDAEKWVKGACVWYAAWRTLWVLPGDAVWQTRWLLHCGKAREHRECAVLDIY